MSAKTKSIPDGFHTVTPCLTLKNSLDAIEFYEKAFGAKNLGVFPSPDGKSTMHAMIKIGDSILMMGDEHPEQNCRSAETLGASPIGLYVYVPNVDEAFKRAVDAGGEVIMPVDDMFWGDRCGTLRDPFGYGWTIATHVREVTEEQMREGAEAFYANAAKA